ncbi:PBSX family phage terminase large subunit [Bacillus sp. SIMBA_033]|uniref:PBSX family phage terminase large subunit n=1 Tax=Bacillus sp. SIMBA_033 TaxID=3085776 RepID=UPI00397AE7D5
MIEKAVNPRFEDYLFNWNETYQFLVGGYGSSKSYHTALKIILKLLREKRTALVVREVFDTHRDSTFALFEDIIGELELGHAVKAVSSPMQLRFSNGSRIMFKGMDNPAKLKSIHHISLIWIEECSEVKYEGFKELIGRLRHPELSLHMICTTNPVGTSNWTYRHFFRDDQKKRFVLDDQTLYKKGTVVKGDTYYHHSTACDNLFLPKSYIKQLDSLRHYDPDLYRIARKGQFGVNGIRVFPQFQVMEHNEVTERIASIRRPLFRTGMDFGFEESYNAVIRLAVDPDQKELYIFWEYYKNKMTDDQTAEELQELADQKELIKADSAEPKSIQYFRRQGFCMVAAKKFPGSRLQYTKKLKRFKHIYCSDSCQHTIRELQNLTYAKNKNGVLSEDEFSIDPHTLSAIWYALDDYDAADLKDATQKRRRPNRERRR